MMNNKNRNKTKIVIIVLAALLAFSLIALAGTVLYRWFAVHTETTVVVPDNLITPDEEKENNTDTSENDSMDELQPTASTTTSSESTLSTDNGLTNDTPSISTAKPKSTPAAAAGTTTQKTATQKTTTQNTAANITLYNKQPQENVPFSVGNMFPGDNETKYYRVQVSYQKKVTVHFKADVRKGYEKLAEVLNVKVQLLTTGETLYEGLMKDMPQSVTHQLTSSNSTTDELYYEITASLDTSVGNDYQNKDLIADFKWWVEETGNLVQAPKTGDATPVLLWSVIASASAFALIILLVIRKKKEGTQNG